MAAKNWFISKFQKLSDAIQFGDVDDKDDSGSFIEDAYWDYESYFLESEMRRGAFDELPDGALDEGGVDRRHVSNKLDYEGVTLNYSNFANKQLSFINFVSSNFRHSVFDNANLVGANISNTDFYGSQMRNVDFEYAEIHKSNFGLADLADANFQSSALRDCDLSWANLRGADFTDCTVVDSNFEGAVYDQRTQLPFSMKRAAELGMVLAKEDSDVAS